MAKRRGEESRGSTLCIQKKRVCEMWARRHCLNRKERKKNGCIILPGTKEEGGPLPAVR